MAEELRGQLGLAAPDVLCPWKLAAYLSILVFDVKELQIPANDLEHLIGPGSQQWSGFSVREAGLVGVVLNSSHPKGRLSNTLMHEISHIYLKHGGSQVSLLPSGILLISEFSKEQEEEADWLSGALLLPRQALVRARAMRLTNAQICEKYGVSDDLCTWRLRMTGVDAQMRRRRSPA